MDRINISKSRNKLSVNNVSNVSKSLIFLMAIFAVICLSGAVTVIEECNDDIDNDGDNRTDWQDPGCYITNGQSETGKTECDDQIDNDGDGWIDWCVMPGVTAFNAVQDGKIPQQCAFPWGDIGCQITHGQSETGGTTCDDGADNDNDALIDVADPGCMVTNYQNETGNTQCSDGIDNDGDGAVDMLDQGCYNNPWWNNETNMQCSDGLDNDGDALTDMNDPGCMGLWDNDETNPRCNDGLDNDNDGLIDFPADPGCMHAGDDDEFNPTPPPDNVNIGSSGSVWNYGGVPMVHWQDQITIKKSLNSSNIIWVEIIITPDSGGTISGNMADMGQDPGNSSNHIYSFTFMPYPAHGATHIQVIEHRATGDTVEDFSIYIDPSGWIYDDVTGDVIVGANVTLYYENPPGSGSFVPVPVQTPAIMLPNVTSMLSDATGHYGWDVIPGNYTVKVSAPGYYPNNSVRIVTIPPAVLDLNVYLTPITGKLKTMLASVNNSPPYIEWMDVNLAGTLVTKCAVACDNNSVGDIADVEAYMYNPSGGLIDHEYLVLAHSNSICWQMVNGQDPDFFNKYEIGICDLYEGNYTLPDNAPEGRYKLFVEVNDTGGEYGNMTKYFNYTPENLPPFIEWMWLLPDEDNFTNGTQVYPLPGGNKTVTKCVIACDSNGATDIADVEAGVYYPDAVLKEYEYLQLASNSSICRQTIPPEDAEFQHKYEQGICEVYEGYLAMEFWEPPGDYVVVAEVNDTKSTYGYMNDTFEYMYCIAIDNDANIINFGSVVPGSSSTVTGDSNMSTLNAPTVRNLCNVPVEVIITGTSLSCTTPATCDAATMPMPMYEIPVQPIEPGTMSTSPENFRLDIPLGALPGSYKGAVMVTGVQKEEISVGLALVAEGFVAPLALVSSNNSPERIFIVDQVGIIKIMDEYGGIMGEPFLNISDKMMRLNPGYDERGLLGLAFHPDFKNNGRFFVYYSAPLRPGAPLGWNHTSIISEFKVLQNDTNKADLNSGRIILEIDKPQSNHNAGQIAFGSDGYLYIPVGDGGGANDVGLGHASNGNGQNTSTLLGKILRIDVDSTTNTTNYSIPIDNPFVGKEGRDEIFAYGFRNPFHISFDAGGNHSLFAGDAGQNLWEEVDMVTKGNNYGWRIKEGTHCFNASDPDNSPDNCSNVGANGEPLIDPVIEYPNADQPGGLGYVVIGGLMYRGSDLPELYGYYIFGDWSNSFISGNGTILAAEPPYGGYGMWSFEEIRIANSGNGRINTFVRGFGQDIDNEAYILTSEQLGPSGTTGKVFKIVPPGVMPPGGGIIPSVKVVDQPIVNGTITVQEVVSNGSGWLVIHKDVNNTPGMVVGHAPVNNGTNINVTVMLNTTNLTSSLWAMLHIDAGIIGVYEFPGPDVPAIYNSQIVMAKFQVLGPVGGTANVTIQSFAFNPQNITVAKGTTVTWTNKDALPHTVTSDSGTELNSSVLSTGQSYSHTFNVNGTFNYHCSLHPSMKGTVVVT